MTMYAGAACRGWDTGGEDTGGETGHLLATLVTLRGQEQRDDQTELGSYPPGSDVQGDRMQRGRATEGTTCRDGRPPAHSQEPLLQAAQV